MAASIIDIKRWYDTGLKLKATHMIVICDTFDWDDYPVFVKEGEDVHEITAKYMSKSMQKIMEVYNLSLDKTKQLNEGRAFNF